MLLFFTIFHNKCSFIINRHKLFIVKMDNPLRIFGGKTTMLNRILGNAIQIDNDVAMQELHPFLTHDEDIQLSFKVMRDMIIFADLRMILVDVQGITGKKREYHSIPYKSITHFSMESGGINVSNNTAKVVVTILDSSPLKFVSMFVNETKTSLQVSTSDYTLYHGLIGPFEEKSTITSTVSAEDELGYTNSTSETYVFNDSQSSETSFFSIWLSLFVILVLTRKEKNRIKRKK